jgi:hypothetical protein
VSKDSNSGVYFMGRYEVQVFDSWQKTSDYPGIECGGIYQRWDESRRPQASRAIRLASTRRKPQGNGRASTRVPGPASTRPAADRQRPIREGRAQRRSRPPRCRPDGPTRPAPTTTRSRWAAHAPGRPRSGRLSQPLAGAGWTEPLLRDGHRDPGPQPQDRRATAQMLKELGYAGIGPATRGSAR